MKILSYILSILILFSSGCAFTPSQPKSAANLSPRDKKIIADYAFLVMDYYRQGKKIPDFPRGKERDLNFDYEYIFVSLYRNNRLLGCQAGSADKEIPNRLFVDVKKAVIRSIEDNRFDMPAEEKTAKDAFIVVNILYNKKQTQQSGLTFLKDNFELGIHSISVHKGDRGAFFISSVPVTKGLTLEKTMSQLCKKASMQSDCYLDPDARMNLYDTQVFKADTKGNVISLYRYNIPVDAKAITQKRIFESLSLLRDWFVNNINPQTGLLEYMYYPSADVYSKNNNDTRQLATLWALTELKPFLKDGSLDKIIKNTFEYYLPYQRIVDGYSYIAADKDPSIALNGFMIMAVLNTELPQKEEILKQLAAGILNQQLTDGSYRTIFLSKEVKGVDYFPGEAMLALMKLYQITKNQDYLNSVKKAFPYYRNYWRSNKNTAMIPWHTQAYYLLYQETKGKELAEFIFEMSDWIIDNYQSFDSPYPDEIGAFPKKTPGACSTAVYMEGMNSAYSLAKELGDIPQTEKYKRSILAGVKFILQNQFTKDNSFYLKNPKRAIGGIRRTPVDSRERVDFIQHTVRALLKTYQNKIFE